MLKQLSFQNWKTEIGNHLGKGAKTGAKVVGGVRGKRKAARPLSTRVPIHLVMKTANLSGSDSLLRPRLARMARQVLSQQAARFHIVIRQLVIAPDQIHMLVEIKSRQEFSHFLRATSGLIARFAQNKQRGPALTQTRHQKSPGTFWWGRPLTRLMEGFIQDEWLFAGLHKKKSLCESVRLTILEPFLLTPPLNTS